MKNLVVPLVGDFSGPKAIRAVGAYLKEKDAKVSAFYLSNVEQLLQQDGKWDDFCRNVAALAIDETSTFIRSVRGVQISYGAGLGSKLGNIAGNIMTCASSRRVSVATRRN